MEVSHCSEFDISGGLAGYLLVMLGLYHQCREREALKAAIVTGDELVKRSSELGNGIGWYSRNTRTFLSGFAHGAAGVCYALCELAKFSGEERFVRAAARALTFVESQRFPTEEDWPFVRLRPSGREERKLITGWCHGAPGIGLAYLAAWKLGVIGADSGLEKSLRITRVRGFESNHSLCHGSAGNAELLIEAGIALGQPALLNEALIRGNSMVQDMNSEAGLRSGSHVGVMVPDLMLGLAGIGYGFLRILNQVPSILTLRPGNKWD
jgi:lantibiotic modifying enzyme